MKRYFPVALLAALLAIVVAAVPANSVSAQKCYDPKTKKEIACPEQEKNRPTVVYPSFTPSATLTPIPSDTPTPLPSATASSTPEAAAIANDVPPAPPSASPGASCASYTYGVPLGAVSLGLGLLALTIARSASTGANPFGFLRPRAGVPGSDDAAKPLPEAGILLRGHRPASLPTMNQGIGPSEHGILLVGGGAAGLGAGLLGAGVLGGLLDWSCGSAPIVLPAAAVAGLLAALLSTLGAWRWDSPLLQTAGRPPQNDDEHHSTFERIGMVSDDEARPRGGSSLPKDPGELE